MAGWAVIIGECVGLAWLIWLYSRHAIVISVEKGADVATLVLTAATVVVTGVGVAVAVVTIWGFREIKEQATAGAIKAALVAVQEKTRDAFETGTASPAGDQANDIAAAMEEKGEADGL